MSHGHAVHLSRLTDGTLLTITRTEEGALLENEDSRLLVKEDFQIVGRDEYLHLCLRSGPRGIRKIGGRIKLIPAFVPATLFGDDHIPVSDLGMRRSSGSLCFWYKDSWIWRSNSRRSQGQIGETNILAAAPSPGFLALVYVKDHVPFLKLVDHDNTTGTDIPLSLSTINDLCWYRETVLAIAGIHEVNSNIVFIDVISKRATEIAYDGTISALAVSESRLYGMTASAISSPALAQLYPQVNVVSTQTIRTHYYTDNPSIVIPGSNQNLVIFLHGGPIGCWHNTYNPITEALSSQGFHVMSFFRCAENSGCG